jgi:hypothetical protein
MDDCHLAYRKKPPKKKKDWAPEEMTREGRSNAGKDGSGKKLRLALLLDLGKVE